MRVGPDGLSNSYTQAVDLFESLIGRPIAFHRVFATLTESVETALFLSQAIYWSEIKLKMEKRSGVSPADAWFYKTQEEWEEETGLSRYAQERARKKLKSLGVLLEERRGVNGKLFFSIDIERLHLLLSKQSQRNQDSADFHSVKVSQSTVRKPAVKSAGSRSHYKEAETTSETTSENTCLFPIESSKESTQEGASFDLKKAFDALWKVNARPRNTSKAKALESFEKALLRLCDKKRIKLGKEARENALREAAITIYRGYVIAAHTWRQQETEERYIPHLSTWLNQSRWETASAQAAVSGETPEDEQEQESGVDLLSLARAQKESA